jgi:methylated-DNA-[protein]-cysteine S-methyltransferase
MNKKYFSYLESPIGIVEIISDGENLVSVNFVDEKGKESVKGNRITIAARKELGEYFKGKRKEFDLPVSFSGTEFQKKVWNALLEIPFGAVATYSDIANMIGNPKGVRAVGLANSKNPISIIVPCHRVIGKNGKLTGYAGGLDRKEWLIEHEAKV